MSELRQIETKIYNDEKIEFLLENLGCWGISTEQGGSLYTAGLPDGENSRSVQVKNNESLSSSIRSRGINGSIYDIVSYIKFEAETESERTKSLSRSKYWICKVLDYPEFIDDFYKETADKVIEVPKYNKWLSKISRVKKDKPLENDILDINLFEDQNLLPNYKWYEEGLSIKTQKLFQISLDVASERVIFPIHNKYGNIIGVKGRYIGNNKEISDKYKYLYLYSCNKSIELFNYHRAIEYIKKYKEVIVVEGAKTTMFLTQWGYPNCVSIEGDTLSSTQVKLLKELGLDIKIVLAFDKDKSPTHVKEEASKITGRLKYGVVDINNLLEGKDSPTDKGLEVWRVLYQSNSYKI